MTAKPNNIELVALEDIDKDLIIDLMNDERVARYLPLLTGRFDDHAYTAFITAKKGLWQDHGFGPWAFVINGKFAGWGGLQPEEGEADFALVLHPDFWGWGLKIFRTVLTKAFEEFDHTSITALLPVERHNKKAINRLGFIADGSVMIEGESFIRYRLHQDHFFLGSSPKG